MFNDLYKQYIVDNRRTNKKLFGKWLPDDTRPGPDHDPHSWILGH